RAGVGRSNPVASSTRRTAAWWLLLLTAALGPIATGRIDAITLPIAVAGILVLRERPALAGAVLAVGAWVKVWPAAVFLATFVGRGQRLKLIGGGAIATGIVVAISSAFGGWPSILSFVTEQAGRGLQVESPAATVPMLFVAAGDARYASGYDMEILTFQVTGPGVDEISAAMTVVMVVLVAIVVLVGALARYAGASFGRLVPPLALALVLALIVTNKVGSPQFVVWVIASVVAWLVWDSRRARPAAVITAGIALLTQAIYPWGYDHIMTPDALGVGMLAVRNSLYVALFVLTMWQLLRLWWRAAGTQNGGGSSAGSGSSAAPVAPIPPAESVDSGARGDSGAPGAPVISDAPGIPGGSDAPGAPVISGAPGISGDSGAPSDPGIPGDPDALDGKGSSGGS
ncbi:MAG: collagen-like triple helix repeat-containing protein, partial [Pseudoclavibacter sp.]